MKALVVLGKGEFLLREVETPSPSAGEALVRVRACGVCGSDIPRIFGDIAYFYPLIPGHEFAGEVVAVGQEEDRAWVGKMVTAYPLIPCRRCPYCEVGRYELCENYGYVGSRQNGAFAEYVIVPVANLIPLPDTLSFAEGALTEPAAVTLHGLRRVAPALGDRVMVFGLGPIGLLCGMWARLSGARTLWGVDIDEKKFALAKTLGFDQVLPPTFLPKEDFSPHVIIEASGSSRGFLDALQVIEKRGKVLLLGNQEREVIIPPQYWSFILRKELTLLGSWNSTFAARFSDWQSVLDFEATERVNLETLISHRVLLEEAPRAIEAMYRKEVSYTKVIIEP